MAGNKLQIDVVADTSEAQSGLDKLEESLKELDKAGAGISQTGKALDDLGASAQKAAESMPGPKAAEGVKKVGVETKAVTKATEEMQSVWGKFATQMSALGTKMKATLGAALSGAASAMASAGRSLGGVLAAGIEAGLAAASLAASITAIVISGAGLAFTALYRYAKDQGQQFGETFAKAFKAGMSPEKFVEARTVFKSFSVSMKNAEDLAEGFGQAMRKAVDIKGGKKTRAMFAALNLDIKKLEQGGKAAIPEIKKIFDFLADPKISTKAKAGALDVLFLHATDEAKAQLAEMARKGGKDLDDLTGKFDYFNKKGQETIQQQEKLARAVKSMDKAWDEAILAFQDAIHWQELWIAGTNLIVRALELVTQGLRKLESFIKAASATLEQFWSNQNIQAFVSTISQGMATASGVMGTFVTGVIRQITSLASWLADTGSRMWTAFMEGLKPATDVLGPLLQGFVDTISGWVATLKDVFLNVTQPAFIEALNATFAAVQSLLGTQFASLGEAMAAGGVAMAKGFGEALSQIVVTTKQEFDAIKNFISSQIDAWVAIIADLGPKLAAAATNAFNQMYQAVVDALKKIKDYIESWIPSLPSLSLPQILGGTGKAAPQRQWLPFAPVSQAAMLQAANQQAALAGGFAVPSVGALAATTGSSQAAAASRAASQSASQEAAVLRVLSGEYEKNTRAVRANSQAKKENQSVQQLLTESQKASNQELASYAQSLLDTLDPMRVYNREMEKYNQLLALGVVGENARAEAMRRAKEAMDQVVEGTQKHSSVMEDLKDSLKSWGDTVASSLADAIVEGEDLGDVLKDLAKQLVKMLLEVLVFKPLMASLTGGLGAIFGGLSAVPQAANQNAMLRAGSTQQQAAMGIVRGASTASSTSGGTSKRGGVGVQNNLGEIQMNFGVEPEGVRASTTQAKQFGENVRTLIQMEMVRQSRPGGLLRQGRG